MTRYIRKTGALLGTTQQGRRVVLPYKDRQRHVHIIGDSGKGKSKLLEHMIRQDILNEQGVLVIDPHGSLYDNIVKWLAAHPTVTRNRKIHLFDPRSDTHAVGFNPFAPTPHTTTTGRVDAFAGALAQVWGGGDLTDTPLLRERLQLVGYILDKQRLSPLEVTTLTTLPRKELRELLTEDIEHPIYRDFWAQVNQEPARDFIQSMGSINRRFLELLASPALCRIFGQSHTIDFRRCMDEGEIVLVRLVPQGDFTIQNARALGTMILRFLYTTAIERKADVSRPFYAYVDEAYDYLTDDIEHILVQTRKFGCHLVLAHHFLEQLRSRGDNIFAGVMNGAPTKIVFGLGYDDALELVNRLFAHNINADQVKHILDKPVAYGQEAYIARGGATNDGVAAAEGSTDQPDTVNDSESVSYNRDGEEVGRVLQRGVSRPQGSSTNRTVTRTHSTTESWQQSLRTLYNMMPSATYTAEDLRHMAAVGVMQQPDRNAVVKFPAGATVNILTPTVHANYAFPRRVNAFIEDTGDDSDFSERIPAIADDVKEREMRLLAQYQAHLLEDHTEEEPEFWGE